MQIRFSSSFFCFHFCFQPSSVNTSSSKGFFYSSICVNHPTLCEIIYYLFSYFTFYDLAGSNVNTIIGPAIAGKDTTDQTGIDNYMVQELDGTKKEWGWWKQKLGANAILAVSLTVCKAGASVKNIPLYKHIANLAGNKKLVLPVPAFNVINGRSHAGNKLLCRYKSLLHEFMILPTGASTFMEAMKMGVEVYHNLKSLIKKKYGQDATNVGHEGGFAPNIQENKEGLELLKSAIAQAGYTGKVITLKPLICISFLG
ncbi:enolase 1-like [Helianthus annuus]|uniref:enolase 1-like n=1 Tax=Helianthus annuus TaxID=4232 RepID=UPI000B907120|nr:enolase 1-like [Helianthus annuus]